MGLQSAAVLQNVMVRASCVGSVLFIDFAKWNISEHLRTAASYAILTKNDISHTLIFSQRSALPVFNDAKNLILKFTYLISLAFTSKLCAETTEIKRTRSFVV